MTIEIIEQVLEPEEFGIQIWSIWIEITDGVDTYLLPTIAPGNLLPGAIQSFLDAKEVELWAIAQQKAIAPEDVFTSVTTKRVLKALALVMLDEINILRGAAALTPRTAAQLRSAIKSKLQSF